MYEIYFISVGVMLAIVARMLPIWATILYCALMFFLVVFPPMLLGDCARSSNGCPRGSAAKALGIPNPELIVGEDSGEEL